MAVEVEIPEGLRWTERVPAGREWLAVLPDRTPSVLKLQYPDADSAHEATALAHWAGRGAIRLLAHDPERRALLVERCLPGTPLYQLPPEQALDAVVDLLPRLQVPAGSPFTPLADEAAGWAEQLPAQWEQANRPYERRLLDAALGLIAELVPSQGEQVLVNQDLHAGNVLRATREPWLAIDPKPLVGEREFAPVPMVRGGELGHSPEAVRHRLDRLSAELGLDWERVRGWTIVHTLAWSVAEGQVFTNQVEVVRWLLDG